MCFESCVVRAWDYNKPFLVAPAMNTLMWCRVSEFRREHADVAWVSTELCMHNVELSEQSQSCRLRPNWIGSSDSTQLQIVESDRIIETLRRSNPITADQMAILELRGVTNTELV